MRTITFGDGGTHATLHAACSTLDSGLTDDTVLQKVGFVYEESTLTPAIPGYCLTDLAHNGYKLILSGYKDKTGMNVQFYKRTTPSDGDLIIEDMVFETNFALMGASGSIVDVNGTAGTYKCVFRRNNVSQQSGSDNVGVRMSGGFSRFEVYSNSFKKYINPALAVGLNSYVEDNIFFEESSSVDSESYFIAVPAVQTNIIMRRNYFRPNSDIQNVYTGPVTASISNNTASSRNTSDAAIKNVSDDLSNFYSLSGSSVLYYVPLPTSVLSIGVPQDTNITDNIIGLNNVATTTKSYGPYEQPIVISAPTNVIVQNLASGVRLTWQNAVDLDPQYTSTYIYYEPYNIETAFVSPKVALTTSTLTYTIPYTALTEAPMWYIKLSHGV